MHAKIDGFPNRKLRKIDAKTYWKNKFFSTSIFHGFFIDFGIDLGGSWRGLGTKDGEIRHPTSDLRYNCDFWRIWEGFGEDLGKVSGRFWEGFWEGFGKVWELFGCSGGLPKLVCSCFGTFLGCLGIFQCFGSIFGYFCCLWLLWAVVGCFCWVWLAGLVFFAYCHCVGRAKRASKASERSSPVLALGFPCLPMLSLAYHCFLFASLARQWFACCLFILLLYLASHASTALKRFRSYCCMVPLLSYVFALPVPC